MKNAPINRESEGNRTTAIRPISLDRIKAVTPHLPKDERESVTDFISNAVDDKVRKLVKKHGIQLPPDAVFAS